MLAAVDHEIECFQPAIAAGIPEVNHRDVVIIDVADQVGLGKFIAGFVKILNQRTWVHFGKAVCKRIFHWFRVAKSGGKSNNFIWYAAKY